MSNFKSNLMDNFFKRPVGAAVLFLNDFHFGKRLNDLNRCARLVPDDVKGLASILSNTPQAGDVTGQTGAIDQLVSWADDCRTTRRRKGIIVDSENIDQ